MATLTVRKLADVPQPGARSTRRLLITMPDGRRFCRACMKAVEGLGPCPAGHSEFEDEQR